MTSKRSLQGIKLCHVLGVSKGVRNNLLFQDEETLIFPGGKHCVSYNIPQQRQEFLYSKSAESFTCCCTFLKTT